MKKIILMLSVLFTILYISCKKNDDGPGEIYGKWKVTEQMSDPGDGSKGKYQTFIGNHRLTLTDNGLIEGNALPGFKSFKILNSTELEIQTEWSNNPLIYRYKVTSKTLWLASSNCPHGCGTKFKRQ